MNTEIPEVILHGEAMIFTSKIPENAKKKYICDTKLVIAESEVTGNDHVIDTAGCHFFESSNGTMFMDAPNGTRVSCVINERHSTIEIPAGQYEFGIQQEHDYLTGHLRKVRD